MSVTKFEFVSSGFSTIVSEYEQLGTAQRKLEQFVRTTAKAFEAQGQSSKQALTSAKELAAANEITAQSFQNLANRQKELKAGSEAISAVVKKQIAAQKEAAAAAKQQEQAARELGFSLKGSGSAFVELNNAFGGNISKANEAVQSYQRLVSQGATLSNTERELAQTLGVTSEQFQVLDTQVKNSSGSLIQAQQIIVAFGVAVSAAIGNAFVKGTQDFIQFDNAIRQSGVISGSTGTPQLEELRKEIERLGLTSQKTPQEIAAITVELTRAGFSAKNASESLNGIVRTSEATGEAIGVVADVIAKARVQFGLTAKDSDRIGLALASAANATNTSVEGLGEALKFIGPAAKASNQSLEDTLIVLGLVSDAGLQAGQGGRNLAQALVRLKVASAEVPPELAGVVRGSAKMREAFDALQIDIRGTNGQLKPLPETIAALRGSLKNFTQGEQDVILKALFGEEGGRALQAVLGQTEEKLNQITQAVKNPQKSLNELSEDLNSGLGGGFTKLNAALATLSISVGEKIEPALKLVVNAATEVIRTFLALPEPVQQFIILGGGLVGVIAALTVAITAYNLAQAAGVVASGKLAVSLVANTGAAIANGIAKAALLATEIALAVATGNFAGAQVILSGVLASSTAAAGTLATALGAVLTTLIPLVAAFAVFKGLEFYANIIQATQALDELAVTNEIADKSFAKIAGGIKGLNLEFEKNKTLTIEEQKLAKGRIKLAQDELKSIDERIAAAKAFTTQNTNLTGQQKDAQNALINSLERQKLALTSQTDTLQKNLDAVNANTAGKQRSKSASDGNKASIESETEALKKQAAAVKEANERKFQDSEKKVERDNQDEKLARDKKNQEEINALQKISDEQQAARKLTVDKQIADQQKRNEAEVNAAKLEFENNVLAPAKAASEARIQAIQASFNKAQQSEKKTFEDQINAEKKRLEKEIRDETAAFNKQQSAEKKAFEKGLNAEQKNVDRQVQLSLANPDEIQGLIEGFAKQDREAALRENLEAGIQKKREDFEKKQEEAKLAFEEQVNERKIAFEEESNARKEILEAQLEQRKLEFEQNVLAPIKQQEEEKLNQLKQTFEENTIAPLKQRLEDELNKKKVAGEAEVAKIKQANEEIINKKKEEQAAKERDISRQEEDAKTSRQRKFNDEERGRQEAFENKINALKKQSDAAQKEAAEKQAQAAQLQAKAASDQLAAANAGGNNNSPTPVPRQGTGRKDGGTVYAGYAHPVGEREPEVFIPGVTGVILNQDQIKRNLDLLLNTSNYKMSPNSAISSATRKETNQELLTEVRRLQQIISERDVKVEIPTTFEADDSGHKKYSEFIKLQRSIARGRF